MKKLSLLLAVVMLFSCVGLTGLAEEAVIKESASGFFYIEANGDQPRLSAASADNFFQSDGLWFKDLNGNGELDVYEDWRLDKETRAKDLLSKMTLLEKAGALAFGGIAGNNGCTVTDIAGNEGNGGGGGDTSSIINTQHPAITAGPDVMSVEVGASVYPGMAYQIQVMNQTAMIAALTGTPKDQLDLLNALQVIAEGGRLGIPVVFSGDRTYNTWGGMIDAAHYAFGVARDPELLYDLMSEYAKESVALGYHQVFHGYGNEIGSFYGDDPNYIAEMSAIETHAYQDHGFDAHSKHFIARGGRSTYVAARSPADLIESWKIGWKAVVDAGTEFIMTNNNVGVTPGLQGYMDKETYKILREDLGYDGVVCLDWPLSAISLMGQTGVTADGIDVTTLTLGEHYTLILDAGVDMFSCERLLPGTEYKVTEDAFDLIYFPEVLVAEIEAGKYTEEALDVHVLRIMKNKFHLGIFENPYRDWEEAAALIAADPEYAATASIPMSTAEIDAIRRPEITAMEKDLMVKSTILYKNDGVLPLSADAKVYVDANGGTKDAIAAAVAEKAAVVDSLEEATVAVFHVTSFNDAYELMIEDAQEANVPVVVIFEGTNTSEPALQQFIDANALMMQTYRNTPDHGSSIGSFYRYVSPELTADMLFGDKEPGGKTLFELAYVETDSSLSWGELQDDIGVSDEVRLYMAMLAKENPAIDMPNNLGDVIVTDSFGMCYSKPADIQLSLLTVPRTAKVEMVEGSSGMQQQTTVSTIVPKAGEPFKISFVAKNYGEGDGLITVPVLDNGEVNAEKIVGVAAGQFRVISVYITLEAGEHTITVGDMTANITVE